MTNSLPPIFLTDSIISLLGLCVKQNPSARARLAKRDKVVEPKKLCPDSNEQACPILGSSYVSRAPRRLQSRDWLTL